MSEKFELKRVCENEYILKIEDFEIILTGEELKRLRDILAELEE